MRVRVCTRVPATAPCSTLLPLGRDDERDRQTSDAYWGLGPLSASKVQLVVAPLWGAGGGRCKPMRSRWRSLPEGAAAFRAQRTRDRDRAHATAPGLSEQTSSRLVDALARVR